MLIDFGWTETWAPIHLTVPPPSDLDQLMGNPNTDVHNKAMVD